MGRLHNGAPVATELRQIAAEARGLAERVRREAPEDGALAHDALQEAVEAILLDRMVAGRAIPTPEEIGVRPEEYLPALGDLVGELRRLALARLAEGETAQARTRLAEMEAVHLLLLRFESPRSIVSLKPKQDQARSILERTRSEVALAVMLERAGAGRTPRGRSR